MDIVVIMMLHTRSAFSFPFSFFITFFLLRFSLSTGSHAYHVLTAFSYSDSIMSPSPDESASMTYSSSLKVAILVSPQLHHNNMPIPSLTLMESVTFHVYSKSYLTSLTRPRFSAVCSTTYIPVSSVSDVS